MKKFLTLLLVCCGWCSAAGVSEFAAAGWSASGGAELVYTAAAGCPEVRGNGGKKGYGGLVYTLPAPLKLNEADGFLLLEVYQNFTSGLTVQLRLENAVRHWKIRLPLGQWTVVRLPLKASEWQENRIGKGTGSGALRCIAVYNGQCRLPPQRIFIRELALNQGGKEVLAWRAPKLPPMPENIVNYGVGGASSHGVLRYVLPRVLKTGPKLAVVMVGTNDMINTHKLAAPEKYEKNLRTIAARLQKAGAAVILVTIPCCDEKLVLARHDVRKFGSQRPNQRLDLANEIIRRTASEMKCPLVDFNAFIASNPGKYLRSMENSGVADGVHPTAEAYGRLAEMLAAKICEQKLPVDSVACIGDSITYGAGMFGAGTVRGECYPGVLADLLKKGKN